MSKSTCVGIVANPASARDVRRLVAHGSAVTAHDKINILKRLMTGLGRAGVERVLSMTDRGGVSAGLERASQQRLARTWPELAFVADEPTGSPTDTVTAVRRMRQAGVEVIVVLGGDGTHQLVAGECGATPLVGISTGTNNAFPTMIEPTVAGLAAGLVASREVDVDLATDQSKYLLVVRGPEQFRGLVDVAVTSGDRIGTGAIWDPADITELFLCFAEADAIGLSAIGSHIQPVGRSEPIGLAIHMGDDGHRIAPPIGPGLFTDVCVSSWSKLGPDQAVSVSAVEGVVAIDGERRFRFGPNDRHPLTVTLKTDGPLVIDVARTLEHAARSGSLATSEIKKGNT